MVDYIDRFSYVEPFLHLWDEADLIMVDDFSDVILDSICKHFIVFCASILFLSNIFVWFGYHGNYSEAMLIFEI